MRQSASVRPRPRLAFLLRAVGEPRSGQAVKPAPRWLYQNRLLVETLRRCSDGYSLPSEICRIGSACADDYSAGHRRALLALESTQKLKCKSASQNRRNRALASRFERVSEMASDTLNVGAYCRPILLEFDGQQGDTQPQRSSTRTFERCGIVLTRYHGIHIMNDEQPKRRASTTGTLVGTRFQAPLLDAIDSWRKAQSDLPTRPEAVRRLVELGMSSKQSTVKLRRHEKQSDNNP